MIPRSRFLSFLAALFVLGASFARAQNEVKLELVADVTAIEPGGTFHLAVRYEIAPGGWHIYWVNPGGTGLGSNVSFEAPDGFTVGATQYPLPHKTVAGTPEAPNVSHTYEGTAFHSVTITAPADLEVGSTISFNANSFWQACNEFCLMPTETELSLSLPVADSAAPSPFASDIATAMSLSQGAAPKLIANPSIADGKLELMVVLEDGAATTTEGAHFYSAETKLIDDNAPQEIELEDGLLTIRAPLASADTVLPEVVQGFYSAGGQTVWLTSDPDAVLETESAWAGAETAAPLSDSDPQLAAIKEIRSWGVVTLDGAEVVDPQSKSFLSIALLALLGGIILNLMPCVFPVLGIKIMGFVNQAGEDHAKVRRHGLAFGAGVLISLWALVAALYIFRWLTQSQAGWGFQLQNPYFVLGLIAIMFIFALNLAGLFEFGTSMTGAGGKLQAKEGLGGSFFSGTLTVLVATPCTGPFMAAALGYALSSPIYVSFAIFTALGIGLALPYVVLSYIPALVEKLPRPGAWMETFKQFMSFPMFLAVIWLVWVFSKATSINGGAVLMIGLLAVALGLWAYGRFGSPIAKAGWRTFGRISGVAGLVGLAAFGMKGAKMVDADDGDTVVAHGITWERFDPVKVVEHRRAGRGVYIDFTATW